jgi:hypothetical protein
LIGGVLDKTTSKNPDWRCLVASGAIEGPVKYKRKRRPITGGRINDCAAFFGIGVFVGFVGAFLLIAYL